MRWLPLLGVALALWLAPSAQGACTGSGTAFDCPATGTADANGADLWNFINNLSFPCGSTITIHPGNGYNVLLGGGLRFGLRLRAQTGCSGTTKTKIVASNLSSFPAGVRVSNTDCSSMPQIIGGPPIGDAGIWATFYGTGVNNWAFQGVCFTTFSGTASFAAGIAGTTSVTATTPLSDLARNIEFDRVVFTSYEDQTYGVLSSCVIPACVFRSPNITMVLGGQNFNVHDSYAQSGTFDPSITTTATISSGTNANPAVLTSTGIAAAFGMTSNSACSTGPTVNCWNGAGAKIVLFSGATGNWASLNGLRFITYVSANTIAVWQGDSYEFFDSHGYDSGGKGALTGTVAARLAMPIEPTYVVSLPSACVNCRFVNNTFEYGQMTVFTGGGVWQPTDNIGTTQAGSTSTSLVLGSAPSNLAIGDLVTFPVIATGSTVSVSNGSTAVVGTGTNFNSSMSGKHAHIYDSANGVYRDAGTIASVTDATHMTLTSAWSFTGGAIQPWTIQPTYCTSPVKGCYNSSIRVGKVTSISGATVTMTAWGPDGSDLSPYATGTVRWNGYQTSTLEFRHNLLLRHDENPQTGKGYLELKNCQYCLVDGNILTNSPSGNWFLTARTQGGNDPWNSGRNLYFSNNLVGGVSGSPARMTLQGEDDEHSSSPSLNVFFINNVLPETRYPNSATASPFNFSQPADGGGGFTNAGWRHLTTLAKAGSSPGSHHAFLSSGCLTPPAVPSNYLFSTQLYYQDNIISYGDDFDNPAACLTDAFNQNHNVFLADGSASTSTITGTWPGNSAVAASSSIGFVGSCTFSTYQNCALDPSSPYRGTASDGGDPGADVLQVQDRVNGWSESAGLLTVNMSIPSMVITWVPSSTTSTPTFTITDVIGNCSGHLYTNPNRSTESADTSGSSACNRSGNTVVGSTVSFVFGNVSPLAAGTPYYYKITDGSRVMVGSFTTSGTTPTGNSTIISGRSTISGRSVQ